MGDIAPEVIPNAPLPVPDAKDVPDYDMVKGEVESYAHRALATQGMIARGTLPLVEITGNNAHKPYDHVRKVLPTGEIVRADFDNHGRLRSVYVGDGSSTTERADFDEHGKICDDIVNGAVFEYDSGHIMVATITGPEESTYYDIDKNGNVLYSRWQTETQVKDFTDTADQRVISTIEKNPMMNSPAKQVTTQFNYDLNNQFKDGEVSSNGRFSQFDPGEDGELEITAEGLAI